MQAPIDYFTRGRAEDGEGVGLGLIPGYHLHVFTDVQSKFYGSPQQRKRVFFLVRQDVCSSAAFGQVVQLVLRAFPQDHQRASMRDIVKFVADSGVAERFERAAVQEPASQPPRSWVAWFRMWCLV